MRRDMNGAMVEGWMRRCSSAPVRVASPRASHWSAVYSHHRPPRSTRAASWSAFRAPSCNFMTGNAAASPADVRLLLRPEVFDNMDGTLLTNTAVSEWDRLVKNIPMSS